MTETQDLSFYHLDTPQPNGSNTNLVPVVAPERGNLSNPGVHHAKKVGFLQDNEGHNSSMRLMSLIALLAAIMFGLLTIRFNDGKARNTDGTLITFSFLMSAFAPKALQKFAERRTPF